MAMWSGRGMTRGIRKRQRIAAWVGMMAAALAIATPTRAHDCNGRQFERVSVSSSGGEGDAGSLLPYLSVDGCTVGFKSDATNLVTNDTNGVTDVFVRDRSSDNTERVSTNANGVEANDFSFPPGVSADGRLVAFGSAATNLVDNDANGRADTFLKNRDGEAVERLSIEAVACPAAGCGGGSLDEATAVSANGLIVAFSSAAASLVPGDLNETTDVFVRNRENGTTELISKSQVGADRGNSANGPSLSPALSSNGRFVVFVSKATNLANGIDPENTKNEIWLWDRQDQIMERISVTIDGKAANGNCRTPSVSDDGNFVAFASDANNLVPGDTNGVSDVFVRDRAAGTTIRIEPPDGCTLGGGAASQPVGFSDTPSISGDGRFVAFTSLEANFVSDDTNGVADIFVFDRTSRLVARILGEHNAQGDRASSSPSISTDGEWIAFQSDARNLVSDDRNNAADVFVAVNPFLTGEPIPGVTPLPTCTPTPTTTPTSCVPGGCPPGEVCAEDEICRVPTPTPTATPCTPGDCPPGEVCADDGMCKPATPTLTPTASLTRGETATYTPTPTRTATPPIPCTVTSDCPTPLVCIDGTCEPPGRCDSDDDCPPSQRCDLGTMQCVPRPTLTPTGTPKSGGGGGGGCGCRVDPHETEGPQTAAVVLLPALLVWLRRRSRPLPGVAVKDF
jgi:MYXO-CTERM domain-containing protein